VNTDLTDADRAVAEAILKHRMAAGVTPHALSLEAGLPLDTVAKIENAVRPANPHEVSALARVLGVPLTAEVTA
jgi:ribosome-binding protein aMBF1 (putative translation factor)